MQYFVETLHAISFTCSSCTYEVRGKVPSFQKVTLFLRYKLFQRDVITVRFCLFGDVTDNRDLRRINPRNFVLIDASFYLHNYIQKQY